MAQSWSVIIFVYNEEKSIGSVIHSALQVLQRIAPEMHELIIVDDGSTDHTATSINSAIAGYQHIKRITHKKNEGIGKALLSGYYAALFENICAIPGDGQFDAGELLPFAEIPAGTIVSFYRTQKIQYTLFRRMISLMNKAMNRFFLDLKIRDINWVKVYKKSIFGTINPILTSSLVESEICAKALKNKYKIIEVPSVYHPREGGMSKGASVKTIFRVVREMFSLCFILIRRS